MAVIEGGTSASLADVGVAAASPMHVTTKPTPYGALGHYAISARTGAVAAGSAANSPVLSARWTDATRLCLIYEIWLDEFDNTTAFTAGRFQFDLIIARGWTVADSLGTTLTLTGDNNQLRTSMGASLFGEIRIATTAVLTAGTRTLDAQPLKIIGGRVGAIANKHNIPQSPVVTTQEVAAGPGILMWSRDPGNEHPIVLAQNEGIVIRSSVPATGVWSATFSMKWCEVTAF